MARLSRVSISLSWILAASCTSVPEATDREPLTLPQTRLSNDSVVLEIGFVSVPAAQPEWLTRVWHEVDEQAIVPAARRILLKNGLRGGVAGPQLPDDLRAALDERQRGVFRGLLTEAPFDDRDVTLSQRRLQVRAMQRSEIVTTPVEESMVVLVDDGSRVVGQPYYQAQCKLALKALPQASGRVQLELTPEIHYGPSKQKWIGRDGAFRLEAGREREVFAMLQFVVELAPGDSLVLTSSGPAKSLGGNAFGAARSGERPQKLLLVRLAQSQVDELFAPQFELTL